MIESLTQAQIDLFPEYVEKWVKIGLSCEPLDLENAKHAIVEIYKVGRLKPPSQFYYFDSPVGAAIGDLIIQKLGNQVLNQVRNQVWNQVGNQVGNQVYGSHDSSWLGFYNYFQEIFHLECCNSLNGLMELSKFCGWWTPYANVVILQHRHCECHKNQNGLHNEKDMAIKYRDGWGFYSLNGVVVPKWIVLTKSENIDCSLVLKEENAQVRAEIVKKVGIDRFLYKMSKGVIDKVDSYELHMLPISATENRPYLKMLNPSVKELWHVEGVHPSCKTVEEALNWRNSLRKEQIDNVNGADWYQQGDVIIRPKTATVFKSQPKELT